MSLRTKLLLTLIGLIGICSFALMSIGNAWESSLRSRQDADIGSLLSKRVDILNADISAARDTLRLLAQTSRLSDLPLEEAQQRLEKLSISQSRFESFQTTSDSGLVLPPTGETFSVRDKDYFPQIAGGLEAISAPQISQRSGQRVLIMFSPVIDDTGRFRGAFSGSLLLSSILDSVLEGVPGQGAVLAVFGRDGTTIGFKVGESGESPVVDEKNMSLIHAHLEQTKSAANTLPHQNLISLQGIPLRVHWREAPALGWKIAYLQSEAALLAPMTRSLSLSRWLLLLVLLAGFAVILIYERMIIRPIRLLRQAHQLLEAGDYSARVSVSGHDELSQLSQAFNRTIDTLEKSEGRFAAIFEAFPHPAVLNRMSDGRYLAVNTAFEDESGLKRAQILGLTSSELNPSLDQEANLRAREALMAHGAINAVTVELPRPDGSINWVMYSSRLVEIDGELCALTATSDITALKEAENSLRKSETNLLAMFEKAPIPMSYSPYQEGIPVSNWNECWYSTFGYPPGSCEGKGGGIFGFWCDAKQRDEFLKRLREDGLVTELLTSLRHADGSQRWCEVYGSFIESQAGKVVMTTYLDITDRRCAELALRASQLQLQAIFNASPLAMLVLDYGKGGQPRMVNRAWSKQFGFDLKAMNDLEVSEQEIWKFPQDRQGLLSFIESGGQVTEHEAYFRRTDGSELLCQVSASRLLSTDEDLIVMVLRDVTEQRAAQLRLAEAKTLVDSATDGMLLIEDDKIIEANPAAIRMFGGSRDDIIGQTPITLSPEFQDGGLPSADLAADLLARARLGETLRFEWVHRRLDASNFIVEVVLDSMVGNRGRVIAVLRDITEQQAVRNALEASEARYRRLHENMLDGYIAIDLSGHILDSNEAFRKMLGYEMEELKGAGCEMFTPAHWREAELKILDEQVRIRGYSDLYEKEYLRRDGKLIAVELRTYLERDAIGKPEAYWALVRDITERKCSEEAADLRRRQLVANLENTPAVAVQWYDSEGKILYWNPASQTMYGFSAEEMLGKTPVGTMFNEDEFIEFIKVIREIEATGKPCGPYEIDVRRRDGRLVSLLATTFSIPMARGKVGFVCMDVDITSRKEAERSLQELNQNLESRVESRTAELAAAMHRLEQANTETTQALNSLKTMQAELVRSEKMAGLGSLVAGVAHELNTPIGNAVMVASTLEDGYRAFNEAMQGTLKRSTLTEFSRLVGETCQILMRNLERAAHLVSSFKQVAVDQSSYQRRRFDLREIVDEISLALAPSLRHSSARLQIDVPEGIMFDSYPGPLGQVLMNLINNSMVHAYGQGLEGPITVSAIPQDGGRVDLSVSDQGKGIPEAYINRIFDPFFTTRLGQGGSGLGLNIVYNLVTELLDGSIEVVSEVGVGTRFRMLLPIFPSHPKDSK